MLTLYIRSNDTVRMAVALVLRRVAQGFYDDVTAYHLICNIFMED